MLTMSQINHIKDLSNCRYRISEISKAKIQILNSTFRQFSGIYLCMNEFYSFTCQCYTFPALLTAVERGSP